MAQVQQPLFGLVPAGQPVITAPTETPSPTSFLYAIPAATAPGAKPFSHLVVFLLPGVALPPDCAAAIYLVTPTTQEGGAALSTKFLGGIGPGKESAIFNISGAASTSSPTNNNNVVIGVSLEPAASVAAQMQEKSTAAAAAAAATATSPSSSALVPASGPGRPAGGQQPSTLVLAQRIIKDAFNYLASFSEKAGQVEVVPLKAFEEWWRKFEGRVRTDPGFLERQE
ncbi:hypothetical protein CONLIGDRAFT_270012 [Coniochaeta ligniaria NRRL 30616]|uniref:Uncharacterized protein n=1 Tax=Coniochaeta ligniaria NRRL 30616 TaxID=1408157 RepID=A0A1J7JR59_9PEZI|nr:hypothetical protein CONLIGDRAFT_270012 [Coniochaeta ligniaria NRRL 30616]